MEENKKPGMAFDIWLVFYATAVVEVFLFIALIEAR